MRIRRYAARLLASSDPANVASSSAPPPPEPSSAPANAAPSSAPPPPEPWPHAAAEDCDLCQLTGGADPQVAPQGIKNKAQIRIAASPEPEAEPGRGSDVCRAESQVAPQGIKNKGQLRIAASPEPEAEPGRGSYLCRPEPQVAPEGINYRVQIRIASPEPDAESDFDDPARRRRKITIILDEDSGDEMESGGATLLVNGSATQPEVTALDSRGILRKVHIVPEELITAAQGSDQQRVDLAERLPVLEARQHEIDHEHPAARTEHAAVPPAAARTECTEETAPILIDLSDVSTEPDVEDMDEVDSGGATLLVNGSVTQPEVTGGVSLASVSIAGPEGIRGVSLADEAVAEQQVLEGVSLVSEAATEADDAVTVSGVTTGAPLESKGAREPDVNMEASSVIESASAAEMDVTPLCSLVTEAATHPGLPVKVSLAKKAATERDVSEEIIPPASEAATKLADVVNVLGVTTGAPLGDKDVEMGASSVNESASEMDFTPVGSLVIEAATHPERTLASEAAIELDVSEGFSPATEAATEPAHVVTALEVSTGAPHANKGVADTEIKVGASLFSRLGSLFIESATQPGRPERVFLANEAASERDVSEGVSPVNEAATEPANEVTALEVTTGAPFDDEGVAGTDIEMGASLVNESAAETGMKASSVNESAAEMDKMGASSVNESTAEMDFTSSGLLVIEAATHPGLINENATERQVSEGVLLVGVTATESADVVTASEVTAGAPLDNEGTAERDIKIGASPVNGSSTEIGSLAVEDATHPGLSESVSLANKTATAREVSEGVSLVSETAAEPADAVTALEATVQVENAGPSVANKMQPSRGDAGDKVGSLSSTSTGPVRDKSPAVRDKSVGKSGRSDIICYARRKGKRKLDMAEMNTEQVEMDNGDICDQFEEKETLDRTALCESAMSTAGSADIKLADIKNGLADNLVSSKAKRRKGRYECDIDYCRMAFKEKSELSVHKKNTCTVKSCGKRFRYHKYLRQHQTNHNEDTPHKCPWENCGMAFKWTCSLADHFQVHTGEKPYRCKTPGCSKIYKYVSDLIRHKKRCKTQR